MLGQFLLWCQTSAGAWEPDESAELMFNLLCQVCLAPIPGLCRANHDCLSNLKGYLWQLTQEHKSKSHTSHVSLLSSVWARRCDLWYDIIYTSIFSNLLKNTSIQSSDGTSFFLRRSCRQVHSCLPNPSRKQVLAWSHVSQEWTE